MVPKQNKMVVILLLACLESNLRLFCEVETRIFLLKQSNRVHRNTVFWENESQLGKIFFCTQIDEKLLLSTTTHAHKNVNTVRKTSFLHRGKIEIEFFELKR